MAALLDNFDEQFRLATERAEQRYLNEPHVIKARYDPKLDLIILSLSTGGWFSFRPEDAQGLGGATTAQLNEINITPSKFGIDFPLLDAQFDITALMQGHFGSRKWMAARLGAIGAASRSDSKTDAVRANGKLGRRPPKTGS
jgi:hypothetical protein